MYCSREYQLTSRFNQQYEKSTSKMSQLLFQIIEKHIENINLVYTGLNYQVWSIGEGMLAEAGGTKGCSTVGT